MAPLSDELDPDSTIGRTSTPELRARDLTSNRSTRSGKQRHPLCRPPRGSQPASRTMDARDKQALGKRSRGRSRASFYSRKRPHSSLDGLTPDQAYFLWLGIGGGRMMFAAAVWHRSGRATPSRRDAPQQQSMEIVRSETIYRHRNAVQTNPATSRLCSLSPACGTAGKIPSPANGCYPARSSSPALRPGWSPVTTACRCCCRRRILKRGLTVRSAPKRSTRHLWKPYANGRHRRGLTAPASVMTIRRSSRRSRPSNPLFPRATIGAGCEALQEKRSQPANPRSTPTSSSNLYGFIRK